MKLKILGNKSKSVQKKIHKLLPDISETDTHYDISMDEAATPDTTKATLAIVDEEEHEKNRALLELAQENCPVFEYILLNDERLLEQKIQESVERINLKKRILDSMDEIKTKANNVERRICSWQKTKTPS